MSGTNQCSSKKSSSSNSSMVNTPASTPVTTMANGQNTTQTSPPPNNNAPKYGTLVPNRIFVGGISANTTESELLNLFGNYGVVKAAKIIQDRAGVSKGYGFITFESEEDAKRLQRESDNIVLRERKLNIAPAIKKQPFSRAFDASSPPSVAPGNPQYFFNPAGVPYFQSGLAYYTPPSAGPADPANQQPSVYQPQSVYPPQSAPQQTAAAAYPPVMFPQPIYMQHQFPPMHMPYEYNYYTNGGAQYLVGNQGGPQSQVPTMQRPNSPPRPSCYGQQLPYNNPPDMYYNMPIYGTVDPTMYTDATGMDMPMSNGGLPEEHYPYSIQDPEVYIRKDTPILKLPENQPLENRQTDTPVVSVLTLDEHQEKDYLSMQSGRRKKTVTSTAHATVPANNILSSELQHMNYTPQNYVGYMPSAAAPVQPLYNNFQFLPANNPPAAIMNGSGARKWRSNERKSIDNSSSVSSVRTDSNSSASIDECRQDEPNANGSHYLSNNNKYYTSRNFQNSHVTKPNRGNSGYRGNINNNSRFNNNRMKDVEGTNPTSNFTITKPSVSPVPQMHPTNQHFVPPTRRNRRTVRRNGSSTLSEIGAGDAPLPTAEVGDALNKLDGLKL